MVLGGTIYSAMDGPGTDFGGDHLWYDSAAPLWLVSLLSAVRWEGVAIDSK